MTTGGKESGFAGNLLAEHQELMQKIADVRQFWHEVDELGQGPKCEELAERIAGIHEHLRLHFAAEERDGYLGPAVTKAPRYADEATALKAEHGALLQSLESLSDELKAGDTEHWDSACQHLEEFVKALEHHEHRENGIVQAAFNDDGGVGD